MAGKKKAAPDNGLSTKETVAPLVAPEVVAPETPVASAEKGTKAKVAYRVFNDRFATVAQVADEEEARTLAVQFKGSYKTIAI